MTGMKVINVGHGLLEGNDLFDELNCTDNVNFPNIDIDSKHYEIDTLHYLSLSESYCFKVLH